MSEKNLYSSSWYRVAGLKPFLRSHAEIHRHTFRGQVWYVLQDHSSARFHRFTEEAYYLIGLMDGTRTLQEIWEAACLHLGDDMPTQEEVITLLSKLNQADVLQSDIAPDIGNIQHRSRKDRKKKFWGRVRSPVAIRIPLFDPDRFLERTRNLAAPFFSIPVALAWLAVVMTAVVLAFMHWSELTMNLADRVLALENLVLLWFIYPVVKTIHEFAHAWAVKHWGGEVHEMGIMFLVFVPVPYLDASTASAFKDKKRRMLVGFIGIAAEMFIASLAMILWVNLDPGALRSLAFNVILVAGVSTIFFNGNPLLRFDAYYVLADYLEIPNLGARSNRYIGYLASRYLIRNDEARFTLTDRREAVWLVVYGLASFAYRMFISVRIALFVAGKFFFMGVLIALWALVGLIVMPFFRVIKAVVSDSELYKRRVRIAAWAAAVAGLAIVLIFVVRVPSTTLAQGVFWPGEQSQVRVGTEGTVVEILARPGERVTRGQTLLVLENPDMESNVRVLEARLREYQSRYLAAVVADRTEERILREEIALIEGELERARERRDSLVVSSPADGRFLLPQAGDLPGRFVRRGDALGYVVDYSAVSVLVPVTQAQVGRIRHSLHAVSARPADRVFEVVQARLVREVPAASTDLPSLAFALEGGGSFALDPRESESRRSFEPLFYFEVALEKQIEDRLGSRVYLRFEHEAETLASQWYRTVRRVFMKTFNI
ncbi:MAG TPA: peptidase M50 [Deltaproteobacteria bacterium]|nr:peptidase M50 [Deltaproteobacteria bacterium]